MTLPSISDQSFTLEEAITSKYTYIRSIAMLLCLFKAKCREFPLFEMPLNFIVQSLQYTLIIQLACHQLHICISIHVRVWGDINWIAEVKGKKANYGRPRKAIEWWSALCYDLSAALSMDISCEGIFALQSWYSGGITTTRHCKLMIVEGRSHCQKMEGDLPPLVYFLR